MVIRAILDGVKLNMVDYLVSEILDSKHNFKSGLAYQPYIMALVKSKVIFQGVAEQVHKSFRSHLDIKVFLRREPSLDGPPSPSQTQAQGLERGKSST